MTPQQIVGLGVRLFAIWLLLLGIPYVWYIPSALARQPIDGDTSLSIAIGIVYIAVAALLWLFPMVVAHRLIPRTNFDNVLRVAPIELARVGSCLLGLWLFLTSTPALVSYLFRAFLVSGSGSLYGNLTLDQKLDIGFYLVQVLISSALILRSSVFASWLMRLPSEATNRESL
jgi:hypothetical protein